MYATKTLLQNWVVVLCSVMTARKGVFAMQLSKELGVQCKTTCYMLQRIREAEETGGFRLNTVVEVDGVYIGGKEKTKHKLLNAGRGPVGKTAVMGAKERGRPLVVALIDNVDSATATKFVASSKEGAIIYTDESRIFGKIPNNHDSVCHSTGKYVRCDVHINSIESVWALLKRSNHGTWHHASKKHLHRYLNEAAMRLSIGDCEVDTMDRMEAFVRRIDGKRIRYSELVG